MARLNKFTKEEQLIIIKNKNISILSDYINTIDRVDFKCDVCGHTWNAMVNFYVLRKTGCPECVRKLMGIPRLKIEDIKEKLLSFDIFTSLEYNNSKQKAAMTCLKCGNSWIGRIDTVLYGKGNGCDGCRLKNENRIRLYLKGIYGIDQGERINIKANGRRYEIDFVVNGVFIEYNGEQHYRSIDFFGGEKQFIKQQKRDQELRDYCLANNIRLIEIPYWLSHEEQYKLLEGLYE